MRLVFSSLDGKDYEDEIANVGIDTFRQAVLDGWEKGLILLEDRPEQGPVRLVIINADNITSLEADFD
jgi:hypothetical protein